MFKSILVHRLAPNCSVTSAQLEESLHAQAFVACAPTQEKTIGWVPPRGEANGPLVEVVGGQWLLKLMVESKSVPSTVVCRQVQERAAQIEASTGRNPGKKETRELKEDARLALLPMAFAQRSAVLVWIDLPAGLLMIDASNQGKVDELMTALAKASPALGPVPIQTTQPPVAVMADWLLSQESPAGFTVDRECELKAADESKAVVRYSNHALDIEEVHQHIRHGKLPTRLGLTWNSRVSFVLTDKLQIKKLSFVDGVFQDNNADDHVDRFDADAAIATGELRQLIPELLAALGGEVVIRMQKREGA